MENLKDTKFIGNDELLEIMLKSDFGTLVKFCQTNMWALNICNSNNFWITKLYLDYPDIYY